MKTKKLVDYLKIDRNIKLGEKEVSLLIPVAEAKLSVEHKNKLIALISLLRKEIGLEQYLKAK